MRLTLRYLLAYLDDYLLPLGSRRILEPEDFEAIGKKVQESEFARSLVDRIRDVVRRGRLGVPSEDDRGAGLDPNTVAEYLDHALPDARVPDFEKVCLESDVHLAEVACCHQVLAMVVSEPVEVMEEIRQQIYQLPEALALQTEDEPSLPVEDIPEGPLEPPSLPVEQVLPAAESLHVPERVRSSRGISGRTWGLAVAGVLAILVLAALFVPIDDSGSLFSRILASRALEMGADVGGEPSGTSAPSVDPATEATTQASSVAPKTVEPSGRAADLIGPPSAEDSKTGKGPLTPHANPGLSPDARETPSKDAVAGASGGGKSTPQGMPTTSRTAPTASNNPAETDPTSAPSKSGPRPTASANVQAGMIASNQQLLLRLNSKGVWQRVADDSALSANDRLLALPAFRPRLALAGRAAVELVDATALTLLAPEANGPFGISVQFGRILAKADEAGGAALRVVAGDRSGVCRFLDGDSIAAIDVGRAEVGAGDPETQPGPWSVDLYVISGKILWRDDPANKEVELKAPTRLRLSDQPMKADALQQLPPWVSGETASPLDQRGAAVLEREVALGRPAVLALRELSGDSKREVRWLAVRSLSLVEDYQPLLKALDVAEQARFWSDQIEQLRLAVYRGPQSAANVRKAMEQEFGPQGAELYELLWKYRADSLQPDDINRLVDYLGHGALAFRVLGFWNLKNLYGKRTLYYRPEDPAGKRLAAIQKWREKLKTSPSPRGESPSGTQMPTHDGEEGN